MNELLDEEEVNSSSTEKPLTKRMGIKALSYIAIMLVVGYLLQDWLYWKGAPTMAKLLEAVKLMGICLALSIFLELFRWSFRRIRQSKTGIKKPADPFWFQGIEGGFGIWILFVSIYFGYLFFTGL